MAATNSLQCDVEPSQPDQYGNKVTIVKCRGKVVSDTALHLKDVVKPLISSGGRIVIDMANVEQLDSSGLGALVGLKASAINQGYCILELANMTARVLDLLRITNLTQMFSSSSQNAAQS